MLSSDLLRLFSGVAATIFLVSQAVGGAAGVIASHSGLAPVVRGMDEISHIVSHLGTLPLGSSVLAGGLAQRASSCGARWIAWLGIVAGTTLILTTGWVVFGFPWLHSAGVFALLAFLLWSAASSTSLLRLKQRPLPA